MAVLEEWRRVNRSILLQGERLQSVDDTCPVIILILSTFLATVVSILVTVIAAAAVNCAVMHS
jgi:hypothetical protein